jgi:hypothetical protein
MSSSSSSSSSFVEEWVNPYVPRGPRPVPGEGQRPLAVTEVGDLRSEMFECQLCLTGGEDEHYLFYCEKDTVVDSAWLRVRAGSNGKTLTLYSVPDETAIKSGTAISNAVSIALSTVDTQQQFTITPTANVIPAGNWIGCALSSSLAGGIFSVGLRLRTILQ